MILFKVKTVTVFLGVFLFGNACRTTRSLPAENTNDQVQTDFDTNSEVIEPVLSLWSPAKRQIMLSYYVLCGEDQLLRNNVSSAQEYYEKAHRLASNSFLANKKIEIKIRLGLMSEAGVECERFIHVFSQDPMIRGNCGRVFLQLGQKKRAAEEFKEAIKLKPKNNEFYFDLLNIFKRDKNFDETKNLLEKLTDENPANAKFWSEKARFFLAMNNKKEALICSRKAYELKTSDPEIIFIYALALDQNGEFTSALRMYERILKTKIISEEIISRMIGLYRDIGGLDEALTLIQEADSENIRSGVMLKIQQVFILWELKKYEEAAVVLFKLQKWYPSKDQVIYLSALGEEFRGMPDSALATYRKITNESPYRIYADYRAAKILLQQNKLNEGYVFVKKAIQMDSEASRDFYGLAVEYLEQMDMTVEAVNLLKGGMSRFPSDTQIQFLLAVTLGKIGRNVESIDLIRSVIQFDANFSDAYNFLGYSLAQEDLNLAEAERLILRALELRPDNGYYLDSLGYVYFKQKRFIESLRLLNNALVKLPNEGIIAEHIGDVFYLLKNYPEALKFFKIADGGHLEKSDRARIDEKLKTLENSDVK